MGPLVLLVMAALRFKARVDPSLVCFIGCMILRFTSGVKPAGLIAVKPFKSTDFGGALDPCHSVQQTDTLSLAMF